MLITELRLQATACLKDAERVSDKIHRLRNAPLVIALVVFAVVFGGLAFGELSVSSCLVSV